MSFIQSHNRAFKAEWLKLRHSGMFWLLFGAAILVPLVLTLVYLFVSNRDASPGTSPWDVFIETNFKGFTSFFYPLFLVIMVVRLVYLEHRSDTWKLLETQPVPKLSLYLAKWEVAVLISFICLCGLLIFSLAGGILIQLVKPTLGFEKSSIDWPQAISVLCRFLIASLGIISIQYFFGLLIKSFAWPLTIGLMAVIAGSIFSGFGVLLWWPYIATSFTATSYNGSAAGRFLLSHEKMSILWAVLFLWLGYQYYLRKSLAKTLFHPISRLVLFAGISIIFIALAWWINRPDTLKPYNKTVIAGTIKSDKPVQNIVLLQAPAFDTVLLMSVQNGKFKGDISTPLDPGIYFLRGGSYRSQVFFGRNDSLHIAISSTGGNYYKEKITGTRIAENEFLSNRREANFYMLTNEAYNFDPDEYQRQVKMEWLEESEKIDKFKTIDNLTPREDFIKAQKSMLAIKLLDLVENYYPKVFAVYHPNKQLKYSPGILEKLHKEADIDQSGLAMYADYRNFIKEGLRNNSGGNDSLFLASLKTSVKDTKTRDYVLFDVIQQDILRIKDSVKRVEMFNRSLSLVSDNKLKADLTGKMVRMQGLRRGQKAPRFLAESLNQSDFDLSHLSNRYVVIDVWATWCAPCKKESPYFEDLADRYTTEQLAFVSVSIDENKNAWRMEAANKKGRVLQLWAKNAEEDFGKYFAVASIPRFMLIDPRGNFLYAELPPPSDPEFEAILQKEISSLNNRRF